MWIEVYQWAELRAELKKKIIEIPHSVQNCRLYYVPSSTMKQSFTRAYLKKVPIVESKRSSFDEYKLFSSTMVDRYHESIRSTFIMSYVPSILDMGALQTCSGHETSAEFSYSAYSGKRSTADQKRKRRKP